MPLNRAGSVSTNAADRFPLDFKSWLGSWTFPASGCMLMHKQASDVRQSSASHMYRYVAVQLMQPQSICVRSIICMKNLAPPRLRYPANIIPGFWSRHLDPSLCLNVLGDLSGSYSFLWLSPLCQAVGSPCWICVTAQTPLLPHVVRANTLAMHIFGVSVV